MSNFRMNPILEGLRRDRQLQESASDMLKEIEVFLSNFGVSYDSVELANKAYNYFAGKGHNVGLLNGKYLRIDGIDYNFRRKSGKWTARVMESSESLSEATSKIPKDVKISIQSSKANHSVDDFFSPDYAEDIISGLEDGKKLIDLVRGNLKYKNTDKIEKGAGDKRFILINKDGGRYTVEVKYIF